MLILCRAPDDLHHPAQLRSLLKDLREVRQAKIRMGLQMQDTIQGGYLNVRFYVPTLGFLRVNSPVVGVRGQDGSRRQWGGSGVPWKAEASLWG
jgi:hypothetical protein